MPKTSVLLVEAEPVLTQGITIALEETEDIFVVGACASIEAARELGGFIRPDVIVDLEPEAASHLPDLASLESAIVLVGWDAEVAEHSAVAMALPGDCSLCDLIVAVRAARHLQRRVAFRAEPVDEGLPELTERDGQILGLLLEGQTQGQIAAELELSPNTVRSCLADLHSKLHPIPDLRAVADITDENNESNDGA